MLQFRCLVPILALAACGPSIEIEEPAVGTMMSRHSVVTLVAESNQDALLIGAPDAGERVEGTPLTQRRHRYELDLPVADGLGVVVVQPEGKETQARARAFHQGDFRDAQQWQPGILTAWLGPDLLDGGDGSLAGLIEAVIDDVGLMRFVENPASVPVLFSSPLELTILSAEAEDIAIDVHIDGADRVILTATLTGLDVTYTAEHDEFGWLLDYGDPANPTPAHGRYEDVVITGRIDLRRLCPEGVPCPDRILRDVEVETGTFTLDDPSCVTLDEFGLCESLEDWAGRAMRAPLEDVAAAAARHTLDHLVRSLEPDLHIQFDKPVEKLLRYGGAEVRGDSVVLLYDGLVRAVTPAVAAPGQGPLVRADEVTNGRGICLGEPLMNALSFGLWDAGNLYELAYTADELTAMGLPDEFPWTLIESSSISAMLPPLMEVQDGVAWLDVGGVEGVVQATGLGPSLLRGSARLPLTVLTAADGSIGLAYDESSGGVEVIGLSFDETHDLLNKRAATEIIQTVAPAMLDGLLRSMTSLELPELTIPPLDAGPNADLRARVELNTAGLMLSGNAWCVPASLQLL